RLLSQPTELQVLTAAQEAAEAARVIPPARRMSFFEELQKRMSEAGCDQALVDWLHQQPVLEDAGLAAGSVWYRFTDGIGGLVHCH
ncbi:MAG TPA: hypothetical protein VF695_14745, partial [Sphingomonas sp.]